MATETGEDTANGHLALNTAKQLVQQAEVKDLPSILFLSTNPDQALGATTEGNGDYQEESCAATKIRKAFKTALKQRSTSGLPELLTHQVLRVLEFCDESRTDTTENTLENNFSGPDPLKEGYEEILRLYEILQMFELSVPDAMQASFKNITSSCRIYLARGKNKFFAYTENKKLMEICKQLTEDDVADLYDQLNNEKEEIFQETKSRLQLPVSSEILKEVEGLKDVAFYYLVLVLRSKRLLNRLHTHTLINMLQKIKDSDTTDCTVEVHPVDQLYRYSLASTPPGLCIIFNVHEKEALQESEHDMNQRNPPWRNGSKSDRESIKSLFQDEFGYNVLEQVNPTKDTVTKAILELKSPRYKFYDSLVVVFMAHGDKTYLKVMDGCIHRRRELIQPITEIKWFAMKPKLFFIQACRSRAKEIGIGDALQDKTMDFSSIIYPPTSPSWINTYKGRMCLDNLNPFTDTLVSFATKWYEPAKRIKNEGSVYINTLVDQLRQYGRRENILTVLTRVNYNVNMTVHKAEGKEFRQAPYFESSLQKAFVFPSN